MAKSVHELLREVKEQLNRIESILNDTPDQQLKKLTAQLRKPTESLEATVKANQPPSP